MESAERLARKGLDLATGNPTLSETNGLAEGQRALDELVSLVNRRLNQARVGASGFRDAVVQHAAQLKAEARLVDNEITVRTCGLGAYGSHHRCVPHTGDCSST